MFRPEISCDEGKYEKFVAFISASETILGLHIYLY